MTDFSVYRNHGCWAWVGGGESRYRGHADRQQEVNADIEKDTTKHIKIFKKTIILGHNLGSSSMKQSSNSQQPLGVLLCGTSGLMMISEVLGFSVILGILSGQDSATPASLTSTLLFTYVVH